MFHYIFTVDFDLEKARVSSDTATGRGTSNLKKNILYQQYKPGKIMENINFEYSNDLGRFL